MGNKKRVIPGSMKELCKLEFEIGTVEEISEISETEYWAIKPSFLTNLTYAEPHDPNSFNLTQEDLDKIRSTLETIVTNALFVRTLKQFWKKNDRSQNAVKTIVEL